MISVFNSPFNFTEHNKPKQHTKQSEWEWGGEEEQKEYHIEILTVLKMYAFLHEKNANFYRCKSHGIWAKIKEKRKYIIVIASLIYEQYLLFFWYFYLKIRSNKWKCQRQCEQKKTTFIRISLFEYVFTVKLVGIDAWNCILALIHIFLLLLLFLRRRHLRLFHFW